MRPATLLPAVLLLAGCNLFTETKPPEGTCSSDQECPAGQRCFVDGCGKLPDDLLAEITTSVPSGESSVDLAVGPAMADVPLVLPDTQLLNLSIRRSAAPYPGSVLLVASGQSALLAGVNRVAQTGGAEASGVFKVALSTGRYTVVVSPLDVTVPPVVSAGLNVDAGVTPLTVDLIGAGGLQTLAGTVLAGPGQPEPVPPSVQLLAPDGRPLSALRTADAAGAFQLSVATGALSGGAALQISPASGVLGAAKTFPVPDAQRFAQPFIVGDGVPPVHVSGTLLAPEGTPVGGATLYIQGTVQGGGGGNTGPVRSADDGTFAVDTLPEGGPGALTLWAIPPPGAPAGLLRTPIAVPAGPPVSGIWTCPPRPLLTGTLQLPDAGPFAGASLRADPVAAVDPSLPLPPTGASGVAGETGSFVIRLDPGVYQLEVQAPVGLPAVRSVVRVPATGMQLETFQMPTGRTLTARVLRDAGTRVPQALVRFFRPVTLPDGTPRAMLLGQGVSDETGTVRVLLPLQ